MYRMRIYVLCAAGILAMMVFGFGALGAGCPSGSTDCYPLANPLSGKADTAQGLICLVVSFLAAKLMPPIAVFAALWASFLFLTSTGDPGKVVLARQVLVWTVIGAGILIIAPAFVTLAIDVFGGSTSGSTVSSCSASTATATVVGTLINIINWFSWLLAILAVAVGLYAGFLYMTTNGEPQKLTVAHKVLFYAIVGIAVAVLAFSIISIVEGLVGGGA
ncbi:hypothetical protein HY250_03150 [Candidatus Azambacteria bacterium]|nr:hypothetical protein [Candidatus Azambacteria bacterium]